MNSTTSIRTMTGLAYRSEPGAEALLDLVMPDCDTPVPIILYLHGGAWITGRRAETPRRLARIAEQGVAVASIDYTFVQHAPFPAQLNDILDAALWLTDNAAKLGVDPARAVLGGSSAGGHLALLSALLITDETVETPPLPDGFRITGMLSLFASLDLTSGKPLVDPARGLTVPAVIAGAPLPAVFEGRHPSPRARAALLAGVSEDTLDDDILAAHSPRYRVHAAAPRTLLVHGTADAIAPAEQSILFAEAARLAGAEAEVVLVDGANHEGPEFETEPIAARIARFARGEEDTR